MNQGKNMQKSLVEQKVDGVSPSEIVALNTLRAILRHAEQRRMVYLPTHDPESVGRLRRGEAVLVKAVADS